jgi:sterol desaturase/sphingolipid hydroxylase (fatty acid hydroxylase superfamily)
MERIWELVDADAAIRLSCFAGVLALMAIWETLAPRRRPTVAKPIRWSSHLGLAALNTLAVRFLLPLGAVGTAVIAQERWGLFNNLSLPVWAAVVGAVIALDLAIYLQHVLFHALPVLWRLHMVHHADLDFDVTTGVRFHTIEILLSMGLKMAAVVLLGASAVAVLVFEVLLNATSMFNHGNVRVSPWLDHVLRLFVVTPEMHRVHHSVIVAETNSNFGFNLPSWDFLFGTYRAQPAAGHEKMSIGLVQFRDEKVERLPWILALPFVGKVGDYALNPRRKANSQNNPQKAAPADQPDRADSVRIPMAASNPACGGDLFRAAGGDSR